MRVLLLALLLSTVALAGCSESASDDEPEALPQDPGGDDGAPEEEVEEGTSAPEPSDPEPEAEEQENRAPTATLTASSQLGEAPFVVNFTLGGSDPDGDALSWQFDADGDGVMEAQGDALPQSVNFTFGVGDYNATLWVNDATLDHNVTLPIGAYLGEPPLMQEIYYLHDEDGGDGTMDHLPAAAAEGGDGLANLLAPGYAMSFPATEPTVAEHPAGTPVEVRIQAFPLAPHPLVEMTASLTLDGVIIGSGSETQTAVALALVSTPCTEWVVTFTTTETVAAGTMIGLDVVGDNIYHVAPCFPGGELGPRLTFNP